MPPKTALKTKSFGLSRDIISVPWRNKHFSFKDQRKTYIDTVTPRLLKAIDPRQQKEAWWIAGKVGQGDPLNRPLLGWAAIARTALNDYIINRSNGSREDDPPSAFPHDGQYTIDNEASTSSRIRYTEGPRDKTWMKEKDRRYLDRIEREEAEEKKRQEQKSLEQLWDICSRTPIAISALEKLLDTITPHTINTPNADGDTSLHLAVKHSGPIEAVNTLLRHGADPNLTSLSISYDFCSISYHIFTNDDIDTLHKIPSLLYIQHITPIEQAFLNFIDSQSEKSWELLLYLVANRPPADQSVLYCCENFLKSPQEAEIDKLTARLTGYNVKKILKHHRISYQAHLTSLGGVAQEDLPFDWGLSSQEENFLKEIIAGNYSSIEAILSEENASKKEKVLWSNMNDFFQEMKAVLMPSKSEKEMSGSEKLIFLKLLLKHYQCYKIEHGWLINGLEGFHFDLYIALRIRFLLYGILFLHKGAPFYSDGSFPSSDKKVIQEALLQEIQLAVEAMRTYNENINLAKILDIISDDSGCHYSKTAMQAKRKAFLEVCTTQVLHKLISLKPGKSYYYAAGFVNSLEQSAHAIYVDFHKLPDKTIRIRVDNLGAYAAYHMQPAGRKNASYPFAIELKGDLHKHEKEFKKYLQQVLTSSMQEEETAIKWLYPNIPGSKHIACLTDPLALEELAVSYPAKRIQTVGNCVVKNHQIGFQLRIIALLGSKDPGALYRWFRKFELACLAFGAKGQKRHLKTSESKSKTPSSKKMGFFGSSIEDLSEDYFAEEEGTITDDDLVNFLAQLDSMIQNLLIYSEDKDLACYTINELRLILPPDLAKFLPTEDLLSILLTEKLTPEEEVLYQQTEKQMQKKSTPPSSELTSTSSFFSQHPFLTGAGVITAGAIIWKLTSGLRH